MADNYKPDSKVDMNSRKFTSKYGYSRDIDKTGDVPLANISPNSTLHNETSLNANPDVQSTIDQRTFKVPSANSALKETQVQILPISQNQKNELSKYFGATPGPADQYDQYSRSFD